MKFWTLSGNRTVKRIIMKVKITNKDYFSIFISNLIQLTTKIFQIRLECPVGRYTVTTRTSFSCCQTITAHILKASLEVTLDESSLHLILSRTFICIYILKTVIESIQYLYLKFFFLVFCILFSLKIQLF